MPTLAPSNFTPPETTPVGRTLDTLSQAPFIGPHIDAGRRLASSGARQLQRPLAEVIPERIAAANANVNRTFSAIEGAPAPNDLAALRRGWGLAPRVEAPTSAPPVLQDPVVPKDAQGNVIGADGKPLLTAMQRAAQGGTDTGDWKAGGVGDNLTQTNGNGLRRTAYMQTTTKNKDGEDVPTYTQVEYGTEGSTAVEYDPAAEKKRADAHRANLARNTAVFERDPTTGQTRYKGSRAELAQGAGALTPAQVLAAVQRQEGNNTKREQLALAARNAEKDDARADTALEDRQTKMYNDRIAEDPKGLINDFESGYAALPEDKKANAFNTPLGKAALRAYSQVLAPAAASASAWPTNPVDEENTEGMSNLANFAVTPEGAYYQDPNSTVLGAQARIDGLFGTQLTEGQKRAIEYARARERQLRRD